MGSGQGAISKPGTVKIVLFKEDRIIDYDKLFMFPFYTPFTSSFYPYMVGCDLDVYFSILFRGQLFCQAYILMGVRCTDTSRKTMLGFK